MRNPGACRTIDVCMCRVVRTFSQSIYWSATAVCQNWGQSRLSKGGYRLRYLFRKFYSDPWFLALSVRKHAMNFRCNIFIQAIISSALIAFATSISGALAAEKTPSAEYPKALHGHWLPTDSIDARVSPCNLADHANSDRLIEITSREIIRYEERTHPTRVISLTKRPRSWQVILKTDRGDGFASDAPSIFLLSNNLLTVVSDTHSIRLIRCVK
jgi:hypothetical protein